MSQKIKRICVFAIVTIGGCAFPQSIKWPSPFGIVDAVLFQNADENNRRGQVSAIHKATEGSERFEIDRANALRELDRR